MKNVFYDAGSTTVVIENNQGTFFEIPADPAAADLLQDPSVVAFLKLIQSGK